MKRMNDLLFLTPGEIALAIGKRARARREELGLSRSELAQKSGVSLPTISRFETKGTATVLVMAKLAHAMDAVDSFERLFSISGFKSLDDFLQEDKDK